MADSKHLWLRSGIIALCLLVRLGGADALKPEELSAEFIRQLQEANPTARVEKIDDLEIRVFEAKGGGRIYYLDNCRKLVAADPENATEIIGNFIKAWDAGPSETPESILPLVKHAGWIEEMRTVMRPSGDAKATDFAFEPLNDELIIVYALESVRGLSYLTEEKLQKILSGESGVRELAVANLDRVLPALDQRGSNGFFTLQAGGTLETSLLLLDRLWVPEKIKVSGDYVVGLPTRDIVVVTGSREKEGLKRLREYVDKALARDPPYRITGDLYVRRESHWEKWTE